MKLNIFLFLVFSSFFICCNNKTKDINESENQINGLYQATNLKTDKFDGYWIFSNDEIACFEAKIDERGEVCENLIVIWKFYIKDKSLYTCICNVSDCLEKKNWGKPYWKIESINKTNVKQTIIIQNTIDKSMKLKLEKTKSEGLDVKDFAD